MSARVLLLVGLLALPGIGCRDKGAVQLIVSFPDFKPGCLRVSVQDAQGAGEERTLELTSELAAKQSGGQVKLAAYRETGWGQDLRVTVRAFERACGDAPLETRSTTVRVEAGQVSTAEVRLTAQDLDGDGYVALGSSGTDCDDSLSTVNPGQVERCNARDDNCDGRRDEGLPVGQACVSAAGCGGTWACTPEEDITCRQTQATYRLYPDRDGDRHGAGPAEEFCEPTRAGYALTADDCDDTRADVNPEALEVCDGVDNDCDQQQDEGFGIGDTCGVSGCGGQKACATPSTTQCLYATAPVSYYPDDDQDTYGRDDGVIQACTPPQGYATRGGDCNDGNPFTHSGARELCDQEDNTCEGSVDENNACPTSTPRWTDYNSPGADSWKSVSLWDNGRGVWVVGGNKYEVRRPGQAAFETPTSKCAGATALNGVWASAPDGTALLGGDGAYVGQHVPGGACVANGNYATETSVQGLTEVTWPAGKLELHFGGVRNSAGRLFRSNKASFLEAYDVDRPVYDVHGLSRETLFAVGGNEPGFLGLTEGTARIYRFKTAPESWVAETLQPNGPIAVVNNRLRGVWVVNSRLAYAVGNGGAVLIWEGAGWKTHKSPGNEDLLSVIAFGKKAIYVTTSGGKVYRYGAEGLWTKVHEVTPAEPLHDIAGTNPGDLWVVGDKGKRVHWPQ